MGASWPAGFDLAAATGPAAVCSAMGWSIGLALDVCAAAWLVSACSLLTMAAAASWAGVVAAGGVSAAPWLQQIRLQLMWKLPTRLQQSRLQLMRKLPSRLPHSRLKSCWQLPHQLLLQLPPCLLRPYVTEAS